MLLKTTVDVISSGDQEMQYGAVSTHDYYVACHLILKQCIIYIPLPAVFRAIH